MSEKRIYEATDSDSSRCVLGFVADESIGWQARPEGFNLERRTMSDAKAAERATNVIEIHDPIAEKRLEKRKHLVKSEIKRISKIREQNVLPEVVPFLRKYAQILRDELRKYENT